MSNYCASGGYGKYKCNKETGTEAKALSGSSEEKKNRKKLKQYQGLGYLCTNAQNVGHTMNFLQAGKHNIIHIVQPPWDGTSG